MKSFAYTTSSKQSITDSIYFWLFWILVSGFFVVIIEGTLIGALKSVVGLIIPQILPVFLIGLLFDNLFIKKKFLLFFTIAIPFGYFSGMLINVWFNWVMKDINMKANSEILIFVFGIMYIGFRYIKVAIAQKILLKEEENKRVVAELQYLRSQLNPHFLFNSLNSIYSLILSKSDKAGDAVLTLSELMRYHIDLSGKQVVDLKEEIALLERYISLEKLKLDDSCDVKFNIHGNPQNIKIAPLIFMPFVENAFKHGVTSIAKSNFVHVDLIINNSNVQLKVSNSIPEKRANINGETTKIGISNTIKRLDIHYGGNYTFSSSEKEHKFEVNLIINLKGNAA